MPEATVLFDPHRLREARDAAGLTLAEVALVIGRSDATVSRYESGRLPITSSMLGRLARLFDRHVSDFYVEGDPDLPAEYGSRVASTVAALAPLTDRQRGKAAVIFGGTTTRNAGHHAEPSDPPRRNRGHHRDL